MTTSQEGVDTSTQCLDDKQKAEWASVLRDERKILKNDLTEWEKMYVDGDISRADYLDHVNRSEDRIAGIEKEVKEIERELESKHTEGGYYAK